MPPGGKGSLLPGWRPGAPKPAPRPSTSVPGRRPACGSARRPAARRSARRSRVAGPPGKAERTVSSACSPCQAVKGAGGAPGSAVGSSSKRRVSNTRCCSRFSSAADRSALPIRRAVLSSCTIARSASAAMPASGAGPATAASRSAMGRRRPSAARTWALASSAATRRWLSATSGAKVAASRSASTPWHQLQQRGIGVRLGGRAQQRACRGGVRQVGLQCSEPCCALRHQGLQRFLQCCQQRRRQCGVAAADGAQDDACLRVVEHADQRQAWRAGAVQEGGKVLGQLQGLAQRQGRGKAGRVAMPQLGDEHAVHQMVPLRKLLHQCGIHHCGQGLNVLSAIGPWQLSHAGGVLCAFGVGHAPGQAGGDLRRGRSGAGSSRRAHRVCCRPAPLPTAVNAGSGTPQRRSCATRFSVQGLPRAWPVRRRCAPCPGPPAAGLRPR